MGHRPSFEWEHLVVNEGPPTIQARYGLEIENRFDLKRLSHVLHPLIHNVQQCERPYFQKTFVNQGEVVITTSAERKSNPVHLAPGSLHDPRSAERKSRHVETAADLTTASNKPRGGVLGGKITDHVPTSPSRLRLRGNQNGGESSLSVPSGRVSSVLSVVAIRRGIIRQDTLVVSQSLVVDVQEFQERDLGGLVSG